MRKLLSMLVGVIFVGSAQAKPSDCKVVLTAPASALSGSLRNRLAKEISKRTHEEIIDVDVKKDLPSVYLQAVLLNANKWIEVTRPPTESNDIVHVTVRDVTTEGLLHDFSSPTDDKDAMVESIASSYAMRFENETCPAFDLKKIETRLNKENRCEELTSIDPEIPCLSKPMYNPQKPISAALLSVRFEQVPSALKPAFLEASDRTNLKPALERMTDQITQLVVTCNEDCSLGRIRLRLPFNSQNYKKTRGKEKNALAPYREIASSLIELRDYAERHRPASQKNPISKFEIELVIIDVSGTQLIVKVRGAKDQPTMNPQSPASEFFERL